MHSYRAATEATGDSHSLANQYEVDGEEVSLRSLPMTQHNSQHLHSTHVHLSNLNPPRSMSPVGSMSGDELSHGGGRRSQRRRPLLDKQVSLFALPFRVLLNRLI